MFDVLLYLVEHPSRIVTKDELLDAVWPDRVVEEANLSQTIFWLRTALREQAGEPGAGMINTARGHGYRFTEEVRWEAPSDAKADPDEDSEVDRSGVTPPAMAAPAVDRPGRGCRRDRAARGRACRVPGMAHDATAKSQCGDYPGRFSKPNS